MTDRDDALDYIYKGWREGRQQRRDVRQQRGYDRTRRMLAPIMAQRARGAQSAVATPPSFADDVTTPDDESTPSINEGAPMQQEMVSTPPAPITDERRMLPMQSEVQQPMSDERRMLPPPRSQKTSEQLDEEWEEIKERQRLEAQQRRQEEERQRRQEKESLEEEQRKEPEGTRMPQDWIDEVEGEKPKQDDKGMGEFFNPKMPSEEDLISEETHKPAFEEAFEEMVEPKEEPKPPKIQSATEEGKKQLMSRADKLNEAVARSLGDKKPTPKPKEKKTESKPKAKEVDLPKEEAEVPDPPRLGGDPDGEDVLKVIEMVRDGNHKAQSELYNALGDLEDTNSPHFEDAKEAIEEFKSNQREQLRELVEENKKKVDEKPKKKDKKETQDLKTTIKRKPTKDEFTRALVKALPMKDLKMLHTALRLKEGGRFGSSNFSPVLVDELGRITNIKNVDSQHRAMMQIAEDPNTDFPMQHALAFPTWMAYDKRKQLDKDKQDDTDVRRRMKIPDKKDLEQALAEAEFYIKDNKGMPRIMTESEQKEIVASRPKAKKQYKPPNLEYGSPFFVPETGTWDMPILEAGRSFDGIVPQDIIGMRSIGNVSNIPDPRFQFDNSENFLRDLDLPPRQNYKEIASIYPSEFIKLIRDAKNQADEVNRVRIGESLYSLRDLKALTSGMGKDMASEKFVISQMPKGEKEGWREDAAGPIAIRGRGFEQYQAEPSYFDFMLAPQMDNHVLDDNDWTSMNDLFE